MKNDLVVPQSLSAQLFGQRVYLDDTAPGGVGHAVEIAADADHALPADTSLEL
ncbi:hypothetical protein X766_33505 [Mesorhizobium sp. LSJC255A00]|nr:hypothetical protein X766_33505 [Mesorhizobium sp. LSJC255A00]